MERRDTEVVRDDVTGTVREETHVTTGVPPVGPIADSSKVVSSVNPGRRAVEVIYLLFGVINGPHPDRARHQVDRDAQVSQRAGRVSPPGRECPEFGA